MVHCGTEPRANIQKTCFKQCNLTLRSAGEYVSKLRVTTQHSNAEANNSRMHPQPGRRKKLKLSSGRQGCQIGFFDAKFHKFGFRRDTWRQWGYLFNVWLYSRQLAHTTRLFFFSFLSVLLKSLIRLF